MRSGRESAVEGSGGRESEGKASRSARGGSQERGNEKGDSGLSRDGGRYYYPPRRSNSKPSRRSDWDGVLILVMRPCSERVHRVEPVRHLARLTVALSARPSTPVSTKQPSPHPRMQAVSRSVVCGQRRTMVCTKGREPTLMAACSQCAASVQSVCSQRAANVHARTRFFIVAEMAGSIHHAPSATA